MCDFSLHNVKSRPAKVGDKLRTVNFYTGTRGFASPDDRTTAVCILPGTELAFSEEVKCNTTPFGFSSWRTKTINFKTAIFRQVNKDQPRVHHDALEFPDGASVLLTDLLEDQEATVLQLPAQPKTPAEEVAERRVTYVGWRSPIFQNKITSRRRSGGSVYKYPAHMLQRRFRTVGISRAAHHWKTPTIFGNQTATAPPFHRMAPSQWSIWARLSAVQHGKHASVTIRPPILTPAQKVRHIWVETDVLQISDAHAAAAAGCWIWIQHVSRVYNHHRRARLCSALSAARMAP
jgi:hypothetical protein